MAGNFYKSKRYQIRERVCQADEIMISSQGGLWNYTGDTCGSTAPQGHDTPTAEEEAYTFEFSDGWFTVGALKYDVGGVKQRLDANGNWNDV